MPLRPATAGRPTGSSAAAGSTTVNSLPAPGALRSDDASAVRFDDPLDEAEAEAGALDLRRDDVRRPVERLEDARLLRGRDADAAIRHRDVDVAPGVTRAQRQSSRPPAPYLMALAIRF